MYKYQLLNKNISRWVKEKYAKFCSAKREKQRIIM